MSNSNVPLWEENRQESSAVYGWSIAAIFACLILCATAAFCGLGFWAIRNTSNEAAQPEIETHPTEAVGLMEQISEDPAWQTLIEEDFEDNSNNWETGPYQADAVNLKRSIQNGKYLWEYEAKTGWLFWAFGDTNIAKDFVVSVEMQHLEGNANEGFGLVLRAGYNKHYVFTINDAGDARFFFYNDDNYSPLMEKTTSLIKPGEVNRITIQAIGNVFTFYINDELLSTIEDDRISAGHVGILTSTAGSAESIFNSDPSNTDQMYPSKFEVDNFRIWVPVIGNSELGKLTPASGRLTFVSDVDGNLEIYSINSDGTKVERLTNNKADDVSPKWSPNGDQIAFVSTRDGNPELYIMDADGTDITRITDDPADDFDPAWSSDGKYLAFASNRDGDFEIYTLNIETEEVSQITENLSNDRYPDWLPKNNAILFQGMLYGIPHLYEVNIDTGESKEINTRIPLFSGSYAVYSRDGKKILFQAGANESQTGIMVYDINTATASEVTSKINLNYSPAWSYDNKQIAFISDREGQLDIYIISLDGKSIFRVTDTEAGEWDVDWTN